MPRKAIDYSNTIIYKIQHEDDDELIYIGHTTDFTKRKSAHKQGATNPNNSKYNRKLYKIIRDNGNWGSFKMIEITKYPCNDANEACAEEDRIMQELKANMNTYRSSRSKEQYLLDNRDKIKDKDKQYRTDNRDKIRERKREKMTCDCGVVVNKYNLNRHKLSKKHLNLMMLK